MAEEIGIVMSLYDKVSPTLKAIAQNNKAFDKTLDELEQSLKGYDKAQTDLVGRSAGLKKALAETSVKVLDAQKSYKKLKDEASKGALDAAIDEQTRLQRELKETEAAIKDNDASYKALYKSARDAAAGMSAAENRAGGGGASLMNSLKSAGLTKMLGDSAAQLAGFALESAMGQPAAAAVSGILSGITSGAAMGAMTGTPHGIAIGAVLGGLSGAANALTTVGGAQDDAFKSYYQQLNEAQGSKAGESLTAGSATAAQRELDAIAFGRLLGGEAGDRYLADLREMAAKTPMEYGDLTGMSRALATGFGDSPERMLKLMEAIGDAGSAVGMDASGMTEMARAMSRMNSSGKATLEYLNIFQDRGVDVIGMLGEALGKTQGEVYDMISKSQIKGQDAASIIEKGMEKGYGGAMAVMAETFSGLTSTLQDTMTEIHNARGEGYNETRASGIQSEIDAYGGALGSAVENVNRIAGENEAYMENLRDRYTRDALSAVLLGQNPSSLFDEDTNAKLKEMQAEFLAASREYEATGSQEAGLKLDSLRQQTEALATLAYESSDQYQLVHQAELDQIEAIREITSLLDGWKNEYETQQEYSKGLGSSLFSALDRMGSGGGSGYWTDKDGNLRDPYTGEVVGKASSRAYGLRRVPYDGYAALLHEGERVLTAREAREADAGDAGGVHITIPVDKMEVRQDGDVEAVAETLYRKIQLARRGGVRS